MNEYLKAFIIGSCYPVFVLFFIGAQTIKDKNYDYGLYTIFAPLYLGIMNMIGLYLSTIYDFDLTTRFFITGLLSGSIVAIFATVTKSYSFENQCSWFKYYMVLILHHVLTFSIIVRLLTELEGSI